MVRSLRVFYWVVTERLIIRSGFLSGFNFIFYLFLLYFKKKLKPRHPRLFELPMVFRRTDRGNHHREQLQEEKSTRTGAAGHRKVTHALTRAGWSCCEWASLAGGFLARGGACGGFWVAASGVCFVLWICTYIILVLGGGALERAVVA